MERWRKMAHRQEVKLIEERKMSESVMEEPSCPTSQLESASSCLRSRHWCRSYQNHLGGRKRKREDSVNTVKGVSHEPTVRSCHGSHQIVLELIPKVPEISPIQSF